MLSGNDSEILFGNFIADEIKGKSYIKWPENIKKGILLHRLSITLLIITSYLCWGKEDSMKIPNGRDC